ncbi:MAG: hypothetical protein WA824_00470 [Candidatus Sulfotelmatobacter sp.]
MEKVLPPYRAKSYYGDKKIFKYLIEIIFYNVKTFATVSFVYQNTRTKKLTF